MVYDLKLMVDGFYLVFRVQDLGCEVSGFGFRDPSRPLALPTRASVESSMKRKLN